MNDLSMWGWPQLVYGAMMIMAVVVAVSKHGEPKDPYSGPISSISVAISAWILYMGGFWN